jgi:hypothetical protein
MSRDITGRREGDSNPRALWAKAFQVREPMSVKCGAVRLNRAFGNCPSAQYALVSHIAPETMDRIMDLNRRVLALGRLSPGACATRW